MKNTSLYSKRWREGHREQWLASRREHYRKNRTRLREYAHKKRTEWLYGITLDEVEDIKKRQNWVCPVCMGPLNKGSRATIDHNHKTGRVRGVLHQKCNTFVGYLENNPDIVHSANLYLGINEDVVRLSESKSGVV